MAKNIYSLIYQAILEKDPTTKCGLVYDLFHNWQQDKATVQSAPIHEISEAGRPKKPDLISPKHVAKRSTSSEIGRLALIHSFTHIEFNAINLALDAAYRFRQLPNQFITDWLQVAYEEAKHFNLLNDCLNSRGSHYGAWPAHAGLWHMAQQTSHSLVHRMAMVPRVMEARGLDVTPKMISKFIQCNDQEMADILNTIYKEEIGHVAIGNHWYKHACKLENIDPQQTFRQLIQHYLKGNLRGSFNVNARIEAGFEKHELDYLQSLSAKL